MDEEHIEPPYDAAWASSPADAWRHRATHRLSERLYATVVGALILGGYVGAASGAWLDYTLGTPWYLILLAVVAIGAGFELAVRHRDWRTSLFGHLFSSVGIGVLVGPLFLLPEMAVLRNAAVLIFLGTALLMIGAALRPKTVKMFGSFLIAGLAAGGVGWLFGPHWAPHIGTEAPGWIATIVAGAYLAYVDYHWTQALKMPRSLDNAVDTAAALEIGIVHRLLSRLEDRAREQHEP